MAMTGVRDYANGWDVLRFEHSVVTPVPLQLVAFVLHGGSVHSHGVKLPCTCLRFGVPYPGFMHIIVQRIVVLHLGVLKLGVRLLGTLYVCVVGLVVLHLLVLHLLVLHFTVHCKNAMLSRRSFCLELL